MRQRSFRARTRLIAGVLGVAAAFVFASKGARAEPDSSLSEPVRVRFDGPESCGDGARFLDAVRARTSHVRAASGDEPARVFRVSVTRDGGASGTLVIEEPTRATRPRTVHGASCEEVVGALALVAALAIDPDASLAAPRVAPAVPDLASDAGAPVAANDAAAPPPPASAPASPPASDAGAEPTSTSSAAAPTGSSGWSYAAGALFDVVGAAAPGAVLGTSAFLRIDPDRHALFGPTFQIGLAAYGDHAVDESAAAGRFTWWVGQVDVCPVRFPLGARVRVEPCIAAEVGALVASASGVTNEQGHTRPWASAGGLARLEWNALGPVTVEAYVGIRAPIVRESFVFNPDTSVYTAPTLMLAGGLGLGVRFP